MARRKGGYRRGTRNLLRKNVRDKGKIKLSQFFAQYDVDEQVTLLAEPAVQSGMYHPRFHGKTAKILGKQGRCYAVEIFDGNKPKKLIVHPIHLKRIERKAAAQSAPRKV